MKKKWRKILSFYLFYDLAIHPATHLHSSDVLNGDELFYRDARKFSTTRLLLLPLSFLFGFFSFDFRLSCAPLLEFQWKNSDRAGALHQTLFHPGLLRLALFLRWLLLLAAACRSRIRETWRSFLHAFVTGVRRPVRVQSSCRYFVHFFTRLVLVGRCSVFLIFWVRCPRWYRSSKKLNKI